MENGNGNRRETLAVVALIAAIASAAAGPITILFTDLRTSAKEQTVEIGENRTRIVALEGYQTVSAVQQWCDAVIREQQREAANHRAYYLERCDVDPPVAVYVPPAPPWGAKALNGK